MAKGKTPVKPPRPRGRPRKNTAPIAAVAPAPSAKLAVKPALPKLSEASIAAHFTKPEHRFINRELSWLAFNTRVLEEAQNVNNPLLERVRFLSISATNLDEFTMVRIAGLMDQVRHGVHSISSDGLSAKQQLNAIHDAVKKLMHAQQHCWLELKKKLAKESIHVVGEKGLSAADKAWLRDYFAANIFPLLTPMAVDPAHPFPFIPNLGMVQVMELGYPRPRARPANA